MNAEEGNRILNQNGIYGKFMEANEHADALYSEYRAEEEKQHQKHMRHLRRKNSHVF